MRTAGVTHRARILVVEDVEDDRKILSEYLCKYHLDFAANRVEALWRLENEGAPYALILLDLRLPPPGGGDPDANEGFRALQAIRSRANPPEVVVISGAPAKTLRCAEATGAKTFAKPITSKLADYVDRQIARAATVEVP
jgi:CheY-like chemotaxis protein